MTPGTIVRSFDRLFGPTDVARSATPLADTLCLSGRATIPYGALARAIPEAAGAAALSVNPTDGSGMDSRG